MIEELIRIENGIFVNAGHEYHFDAMLSKGECVGIYVDNHRTSGTAFREFFSEKTRIESGKVFIYGKRTGYSEMHRWVRENTIVIDRNRFQAKELTALDYVCAFDKSAHRVRLHAEADRLFTKEAKETKEQMGILFDWDTPLTTLSMPDYYRLSAYKAWLSRAQIVVLDRITEILRQQDLKPFMDCIRLLMEHGTAVFLMDLDENFMFRFADRIDILKNRRLCYSLDPDEYGSRLYDILGWKPGRLSRGPSSDEPLSFFMQPDPDSRFYSDSSLHSGGTADRSLEKTTGAKITGTDLFNKNTGTKITGTDLSGKNTGAKITGTNLSGKNTGTDSFHAFTAPEKTPVLSVSNLTFSGIPPMDFSLDSGEIGLLQDENYRTGICIQNCFLGKKNWEYGTFLLDGRAVTCRELRKMVGTKIAVQIAMPDRAGGVLFDNLSALENLSTSLIPKAGKHILRKHMMDSILDEASEWFDKDDLLKPISTWSMPNRLRLSYFKWYLMNPRLLICLFPFLGQESIYHEMILDMLVLCAKRGIAVWVISSGIHSIHEKARSREFLERVRFLD